MTKEQIVERPLDDRESAVLTTVIHDYIETRKPVGSRSFVQKYSFTISPATMRNIMSDLETMGYLMQPHTSAGRIPTDKGYRYYVNTLLDSYNYSFDKEISVKEEFFKRELQLEKIFCSITKMMSQISKLAGIMLTPKLDFTVVKRIELVSLDNNQILMILVTRTGMVINKKISISSTITQDDLHDFSKYLTSELSGYSMSEIRESIFGVLRNRGEVRFKTGTAIDIAELALKESTESDLCIDGIENLLKIPEMVEENRLKSLLNIIEEKNILRNIMEMTMDMDGVRTLIGGEIEDDKVSGCSMVTTAYKIGNKNVGVLGVIGPTRMDYDRVVPLVDYSGKIVSDLLTQMSK